MYNTINTNTPVCKSKHTHRFYPSARSITATFAPRPHGTPIFLYSETRSRALERKEEEEKKNSLTKTSSAYTLARASASLIRPVTAPMLIAFR